MKTMLLEGTTLEWMHHRVMPSVKYTKKRSWACSGNWDKTLQLEGLVRGFHCSFVLSNKAYVIIEYTNSTQSSYSG